MKKTIINILIAISCFTAFGFASQTYADEPKKTKTSEKNIIYVTEKVPGASCKLQTSWSNKGMYKCEMEKWFGSIMKIMWKLLKYFTFIAGLLAVLMIVVGWIMYSMWGADESMKTKSKEFITKSLLGLILLLMSGTILYAVAPWVYK